MSAVTGSRRTPWADAWCRECSYASRVGQWIAACDMCPFCGASGSNRLSWALLRVYHPEWPLYPVIGTRYSHRCQETNAS